MTKEEAYKMSRGVKIVLFILVLALVCGLGTGCWGYYLLGKAAQMTADTKITAQNRKFAAAGVTEIETKLDVADIEVYQAEGEEIILDYYDGESSWYDVTQEGGVLSIRHSTDWREYARLNWNVNREYYQMRLGLPQAFAGGLELSAASGKISILGLSLPEDIKLATASGDITVEAVSCGGLDIGVASGRMTLDGISAVGDISIGGATGKLTAQQVQCEAFKVKLATGDADADTLTVQSIDMRASTGALELAAITCEGPIHLETTTGSIRCEVTDGIENYSITSGTTTGSSNLPEQLALGEKPLEVHTTTGSIDFTFANTK